MLSWLLLHFAIGVAGTWLARRYALGRDLLDHPGERRSHEVPTPRGGGIAIVIALLVAACVLAWRHPQYVVLIGGFTIGLLLVSGAGLADDHRPLSPWLRLAVQFIAAGIFSLSVAGASGDLFLAAFAFGAVMVLTNVWNFMDGINGIAASQAALVAAGFAWVLGGVWQALALALVGACAGFLPFNFPRARIFLGDVGSGALGFALAALLTLAIARGAVAAPLLFLPLAAFLVDSSLTLARRVVRGERWWTPHAQHAYQHWASRLRAHAPVTLGYAGWTAAAWLLVWWLSGGAKGAVVTGVCAAWTVTSVAVWAWLQYSGNGERGTLAAQKEKEGK